jgi:hypothetical protein
VRRHVVFVLRCCGYTNQQLIRFKASGAVTVAVHVGTSGATRRLSLADSLAGSAFLDIGTAVGDSFPDVQSDARECWRTISVRPN